MAAYNLGYTKEDVAEVLMILRVQRLKKSEEAFGAMLGVKGETIRQIEEGKSAHIFKVFQKCLDKKMIEVVQFTIEV